MNLTRTIFLALTPIALSLGTVAQATDKPLVETVKKNTGEQAEGVTVTGRVTNLKPVKPYFSKESYLQLLAVQPGGLGVKAEQGLLTYKSDLAKSFISANGAFRLQASKLKPGSYFVVVQKVQQGEQGVPFLMKANERWKIEISSDAKLPLVIDGGDVELP
jgi:hypothetical protein